jgi:hypothetical protein
MTVNWIVSQIGLQRSLTWAGAEVVEPNKRIDVSVDPSGTIFDWTGQNVRLDRLSHLSFHSSLQIITRLFCVVRKNGNSLTRGIIGWSRGL